MTYSLFGFDIELSDDGSEARVLLNGVLVEEFADDVGRCKLEKRATPQVQAQRFAKANKGKKVAPKKKPEPKSPPKKPESK